MLICFISVVCSGWGGVEDSADSDQVCLGNMLGSVSLGPHDQELLDEQGSSPSSSMDKSIEGGQCDDWPGHCHREEQAG